MAVYAYEKAEETQEEEEEEEEEENGRAGVCIFASWGAGFAVEVE